jgi:hypothetical protein
VAAERRHEAAEEVGHDLDGVAGDVCGEVDELLADGEQCVLQLSLGPRVVIGGGGDDGGRRARCWARARWQPWRTARTGTTADIEVLEPKRASRTVRGGGVDSTCVRRVS